MSKIICSHEQCTGCSACRDVCPKYCISMQPDELDATYPVIDESVCIDCGLCEKTCPNNRDIEFRYPQNVYVAWSKDNEVRRTSASGGIAYELYKYWIAQGGVATGVVYNREEGGHFVLVEKEEDIKPTQNSKYTFSDTTGIYSIVKEKLQTGVPVLFIGVPCQVTGLYGYLKKVYDNLTTVDLICHGMPPAEYLKQHVESIERRKKECTKLLNFRDPQYHTSTYTFTLKNSRNKEFYKKKILNTDNYQLGFHKSLIFRENCYHCIYARRERVSDLTIGDFSGLGRFAPFVQSKYNTSCILQNTSKGEKLIKSLSNNIYIEERPEREAFDIENQLKYPSTKHRGRMIFENLYKQNKDFEKAANRVLIIDKIHAIIVVSKLHVRAFGRSFLEFFHLIKKVNVK